MLNTLKIHKISKIFLFAVRGAFHPHAGAPALPMSPLQVTPKPANLICIYLHHMIQTSNNLKCQNVFDKQPLDSLKPST